MPTSKVVTLASCPEAAESLAILASALAGHLDAPSRRVIATDDSRSSEEGLAVLKCYVAITDRRVRQALLDVLTTIAQVVLHD